MLCNDLTTEAVRAKDLPIPVSHATANVSARKVDLGPWVPELEVILVSAGAGLPFHVRLPENFATTDEEVGTYEADYRWSASSLTSIYTPFDHAAMLVFWRSSSIMYPKDVSQLIMGSIGERGRVTPRSDLVVVNCLEGLNDGKLRWKLTKKRVEKMKLEGDWVMAIFRSDCCVIGEPSRIPLFSAAAWTNGASDIGVSLQSVAKSPHHSGEKSLLERASGQRLLVRSYNALMYLFPSDSRFVSVTLICTTALAPSVCFLRRQ